MPNNVIEIVLRAKDQATGALKGVASGLGALKGALAAVGAGVVLRKIIDSTIEAEKAVSQLSIAYRNSAESARRSQKELLDFSAAAQRSSVFDDESVTRAQASLLRFGRVSGDVFTRARKDILDVASALNIDLESAATTVGRALESPTQGMRQLRALNIIFTESQREVIKNLEETGHTAEAQALILQALEKRYQGAAEAARNTLGGALTGLKNAFEDLFESSTQGTSGAVEGINAISAALSSEALKSGVNDLFEGLGRVLTVIVKIGETTASVFGRVASAISDSASQIDEALESKLGAVWRTAKSGAKLALNPIPGILGSIVDQLSGESSRSPSINKGHGAPRRARAGGQGGDPSGTSGDVDTSGTADLRTLIHPLPVIDEQTLQKTQDEFERMSKSIEESTSEIPKMVKTALDHSSESVTNFVDSFKRAFEDIVSNGKISLKDFVRTFLIELARKDLFSAIEKIGAALKDALRPSGSGSSSGSILSTIGHLFGFAGGGKPSGLAVVGEEGPELVNFGGGGQVWNKRQLAFSGGGSAMSFAPVTNITIEAKDSDAASLRKEFSTAIALNNKRQDEHFQRLMKDNGYGRLR
jgi:phage-related minor tail protein